MLASLKVIKVELDNYDFPNIQGTHISEATYYRLFIEDYLSDEINFITYLDCDVFSINNPLKLINKNIEEMERTPRARMKRTERSVSPPGDRMTSRSDPNDIFKFVADDRMTFQEGGMIPPEKKGFNMLPESVQNKIDPGLAAEFMHGGEVHAPDENVSRGTRAAIKGKKFSGVY